MDEASYRPRTARDALIAEMLGDVGRLHQSVVELREQLPTHTRAAVELIQLQTDNTIESLMEALGRVVSAANTFKPQFDAYINEEAIRARNEILQTGINAQKKVIETLGDKISDIERATSISKKDIARATADRLVDINNRLGDTVRDSLSEYSKKFAPRPFRLGLILMTACLFVGVLSTTLTYSAVRYFENTKQQQAKNIGVAVQESWQQLDEKSRAMIRSKINQRRDGKE